MQGGLKFSSSGVFIPLCTLWNGIFFLGGYCSGGSSGNDLGSNGGGGGISSSDANVNSFNSLLDSINNWAKVKEEHNSSASNDINSNMCNSSNNGNNTSTNNSGRT